MFVSFRSSFVTSFRSSVRWIGFYVPCLGSFSFLTFVRSPPPFHHVLDSPRSFSRLDLPRSSFVRFRSLVRLFGCSFVRSSIHRSFHTTFDLSYHWVPLTVGFGSAPRSRSSVFWFGSFGLRSSFTVWVRSVHTLHMRILVPALHLHATHCTAPHTPLRHTHTHTTPLLPGLRTLHSRVHCCLSATSAHLTAVAPRCRTHWVYTRLVYTSGFCLHWVLWVVFRYHVDSSFCHA